MLFLKDVGESEAGVLIQFADWITSDPSGGFGGAAGVHERAEKLKRESEDDKKVSIFCFSFGEIVARLS